MKRDYNIAPFGTLGAIINKGGQGYTNNDYFNFNKDDKERNIRVSPNILLDHHPIQVVINFNSVENMLHRKTDSFLFNVSLIEDEDYNCTTNMIRQINKWEMFHSSGIPKWEQNFNSWRNLFQSIGKKKAKDCRNLKDNLNHVLKFEG